MKNTCDVAIIGGGAAGCAVAYYLAKAGVRATIVEREGVGLQASGYSAGGLHPLQGAGIPGPMGPMAIASFRMHLDLWDQLKAESDLDFKPERIARVEVAFEDSDLPNLEETLKVCESTDGFSARWMDDRELRDLEPRLSPRVIRGLHTFGDAALNSLDYTVALSRAAEGLGTVIRKGIVNGLKKSNAYVTGLTLEDGELLCDRVVVAAGPWSARAGGWLAIPIPVSPQKGEILRMEVPGGPLPCDFSSPAINLFRRPDGLAWIGATEELRGFDTSPSAWARQFLLDRATRLVPAMADARLVKHTACLRPLTSDRMPIIGKAPGWENVYLATGAGKKGILISPGMGKAIADLITTGETRIPIEPFSPDRFRGVDSVS